MLKRIAIRSNQFLQSSTQLLLHSSFSQYQTRLASLSPSSVARRFSRPVPTFRLRPGPSSHRSVHTECLEVYLQKCTKRLQFPFERDAFRCMLRKVAASRSPVPPGSPLRRRGSHIFFFYIISLYAGLRLFLSFLFTQRRATNSDSEGSVLRTSEAIIETESTFELGVSCGDRRSAAD